LDTDYENYTIVYNCEQREHLMKEWFYVQSRSKDLSDSMKGKVEMMIDQFFDRKSSVFVTEKKYVESG
jgi:hypothetical protein